MTREKKIKFLNRYDREIRTHVTYMSSLYTVQDYTVFPYILNILVVVPEIVAEYPAVILEKYEFRSARVYRKKNWYLQTYNIYIY